MNKALNIILIEADRDDYLDLKKKFDKIPIINSIIWTTSIDEAQKIINSDEYKIGLAIMDYFTEPVCVDPINDRNCEFVKLTDSKQIPLVYLSNSSDPFVSVEAYKQGALALLEKPIRIEQFLAVIEGINSLGVEIVKI